MDVSPFLKWNKGVDVLLFTAYLLEQGWIDDMSIVQNCSGYFQRLRRSWLTCLILSATMLMLDEMEQQMEKYNKTNPKRKVVHAKDGNDIKRAVRAGICALFILWKAHILYRENWEEKQ